MLKNFQYLKTAGLLFLLQTWLQGTFRQELGCNQGRGEILTAALNLLLVS